MAGTVSNPVATGQATGPVAATTGALSTLYGTITAPFTIPPASTSSDVTAATPAPNPVNPALMQGVNCAIGSDPTSLWLCQNGLWLAAGAAVFFMMMSMSRGRSRR